MLSISIAHFQMNSSKKHQPHSSFTRIHFPVKLTMQKRWLQELWWVCLPSIWQYYRDMDSPSTGSGSASNVSWRLTVWSCPVSSSTCLHRLQMYPSCTRASGSEPSCLSQSAWTHLRGRERITQWTQMPQSTMRNLWLDRRREVTTTFWH